MSSRTQFARDLWPEQFRRREQLGRGLVASISLMFSGAAKSRFLWQDAVYRERYQIMQGFPWLNMEFGFYFQHEGSHGGF